MENDHIKNNIMISHDVVIDDRIKNYVVDTAMDISTEWGVII